MNSYNGFTPAQRMKALQWSKQQVALGLRDKKPESCDICGQRNGFLCRHSENYSEPFGDHIGELGLCYICHMMIHCRFKNPDKWASYKKTIAENMRYVAYKGANWLRFKKEFLSKHEIFAFVETSSDNNIDVINKIESGYYLNGTS